MTVVRILNENFHNTLISCTIFIGRYLQYNRPDYFPLLQIQCPEDKAWFNQRISSIATLSGDYRN